MNRLFALSFENQEDREDCTWDYLRTVKIKCYKVKIDREKLFWSTYYKWYKNIWEH